MSNEAHAEGQQHPLGVYIKVWVWLFILSTGSYMVDYYHLEGYLRWSLILLFMVLKAGLIMAIFMHLAWERLALVYALGIPILAILLFIFLMVHEGDYTFLTRDIFFSFSSPQ